MLIKVRVRPCSKEEEVVMIASDAYKVSVREKPEMGLANERVKQLLAMYFAVGENKVRLIKGAHESHKIFDILD